MTEIFELEALMKSLLEKLDVVEMSNENQVINVDREDDSAISCVEAKRTKRKNADQQALVLRQALLATHPTIGSAHTGGLRCIGA